MTDRLAPAATTVGPSWVQVTDGLRVASTADEFVGTVERIDERYIAVDGHGTPIGVNGSLDARRRGSPTCRATSGSRACGAVLSHGSPSGCVASGTRGTARSGYRLPMTDPRRAPTLVDVAREAGVSHQTVSRVLNAFDGVRPATRERVLAAIVRLGYRRNLAARALAAGRTHAIGILTPSVAEHGPTSSLFAVEGAARAHGYHPLVTAAATDDDATRAGLEFLLDQAVEALVVVVPHAGVLRAIRDLGIALPVVGLQAPAGPSSDVVGVDHVLGARLAAEHLVALGHRRIQHVSGPAGWAESEGRRQGFAEAIAAAGLEVLPVVQGDWTAAAGFAAAARLDPGVTAVACANDQLAIGLMAALSDAGRRVPDEVSVTGFDDLPEAAYLRPALTTVRQDFDAIGRRAVELIARRLSGGTDVANAARAAIAIDPVLVVRASTAPV